MQGGVGRASRKAVTPVAVRPRGASGAPKEPPISRAGRAARTLFRRFSGARGPRPFGAPGPRPTGVGAGAHAEDCRRRSLATTAATRKETG